MKHLNKAVLAAAISFSGLVMAAEPPTPLVVDGGTVHFVGEITAGACAVDIPSDGQVVDMGQVRAESLSGATGTYSGTKSFNIVLLDCDTTTYTTASFAFTGNVGTDTTVLQTSNLSGTSTAGAATGVGIELRDRTNAVLGLDGTFSAKTTLIPGKNTIPLQAVYKSVADTVTAGRADADATFQIKYE